MGRRTRPQCDQIRPAGARIEPAEVARGLSSEPHRTIRRGIDIVRPSPRYHRKVRISISACAAELAVKRQQRYGAAPPRTERGRGGLGAVTHPSGTDGSNPAPLWRRVCEPSVPEPYHNEFTRSIGTRNAVNTD
jgi:hypothetical protein